MPAPHPTPIPSIRIGDTQTTTLLKPPNQAYFKFLSTKTTTFEFFYDSKIFPQKQRTKDDMMRLELWPAYVSQMEIMDLNSVMAVPHRAKTIVEKRPTLTYGEEYSEKMNALDLVINVLKDHERRLDELLWRLEAIVEDHRQRVKEDKPESFKEQRHSEPRVTQCKGWAEFKEKSKGARRTAFKVEEKILTVESLTEKAGYRYVEKMCVPVDKMSLHIKGYENKNIENVESVVGIFKKKLECGLQASVKSLKFRSPEGEEILVLFYHIDPEGVKSWLSKELMVPEEDIAAGRLIF